MDGNSSGQPVQRVGCRWTDNMESVRILRALILPSPPPSTMPATDADNRQNLEKQVGTTKDLVEVALQAFLTLKPEETGTWAGQNKNLLVRRSRADNRAIQLNHSLEITLGCPSGCRFSSNSSSFRSQGMGAFSPAGRRCCYAFA